MQPRILCTFISLNFLSTELITANGCRHETLGISELLHYQGTPNFDARTKARITTSPPMFYDRASGAGLYSFSITYVHSVQLFLFYQGRQSSRAFGQPYSLTSFGLCSGSFERLGNVYGCEGLAYLFRLSVNCFHNFFKTIQTRFYIFNNLVC